MRSQELEARLSKGWAWLEENPNKDRPGQREFDRWMSLLDEYILACMEERRERNQHGT